MADMQSINDSAGGPATPQSVIDQQLRQGFQGPQGPNPTQGSNQGGALTPQPDGQYKKGITKGDIKVTKLSSDNYQRWSDSMFIMLKAKKLWPIVSGRIPCPSPLTRPFDYENWTMDDDQAVAWIYSNLEDSQLNHLKGLSHSASIWEALKTVHGQLGQGRLNLLLRKFLNYKAKADETIDDIASELTRLQLIIRDIKPEAAPNDLILALTLINSVDHEAYATAKYHLEETRDLTLSHTKERLKSVEQRLKDEIQGDEIANKASSHKKGGRKCFHCDLPGHIKIRCYKWLATDEGKEYARTHQEEAKKSEEPHNASRTRKPSKTIKKSKPSGKARAAREDSDVESGAEDSAWLVREDPGFCNCMARSHNSVDCGDSYDNDHAYMTRDQEAPTNAWIIDSGASRHMTPHGNFFTSKRSVRTSVTVANGERLYARGIGNIEFDLEGQTIRMIDVLHVPELDANLLSISALNRQGLTVIFRNGGVDIRQGGTLVASGIMRGKMYYLQASAVALLGRDADTTDDPETSSDDRSITLVEGEVARRDEPEGSIAERTTKRFCLYRLWHARMGHVSPRRLKTLSQHVLGLDGILSPTLQDLNCIVCNYSNMTRVVNRKTPRRASRRLGRVHTNVWGPYRVTSLGGHRYFVSLIDDLTRRSWLLCMRSRDEIYAKIGEWKSAISLQTGEKVAIYRCDNAKEYQKFERLIHDAGVRMEYTTAYTPEENGVAERFNRTIIQMARAMLIWAQLPQTFWGEAVVAANYLRNLLPAGHDDLSPSQLWNGYKPEISHLKTFGCLVHVHIPSETRAKLDKVSFQGIFVGYHSNQQVRVYNPSTKRVQWHTAVKFIEKTPGGLILKEGPMLQNVEIGPNYENDDDEDEEAESNELPTSSTNGPTSSSKNAAGEIQAAQTPTTLGDSNLIVPPGDIIEPVGVGPINPGNIPTGADELQRPPNSGASSSSGAQGTNTSGTAPSENQRKSTPKPKGRGPTAEPTRRSIRTTKPFDKYRYDKETGRKAGELGDRLPDRRPEPAFYNEAMGCEDKRLWQIAIDKQLNALIANGTWVLVKRPAKNVNIITSKWVFKIKYTSTGLIDRYKARLVARGFTQVHGIDYEETFAPTLRLESLRMLLAFAAYFGFEIEQMDVPDAYLKGDLKEVIYMEVPQGYELPNRQQSQVLQLKRPLYGLKQSGREWNAKIKNHLKSIGFLPINSDNCVFINTFTHVIIAIYVVDLLIFAKSMTSINAVKAALYKEYKMKDNGPADFILGISIKRDAKRLAINQSTYIRKILRDYGMEDCRPVSTPIDGYYALTPSGPADERTDQMAYQMRIGSVMYVMVGTRPDIAFAVCKLSQYCQDPCVRHRTALDRVLRYLKGTVDLALVYDYTIEGEGKPVAYADAAYGDDLTDRKSTYGHTLLIGNAATTWASKKQRTIATSTTEAEYVAICQASKNLVWATRWIRELNFDRYCELPIALFEDNQGALDLIKNPEHHSRTKHIDIQYHYIREVVADGKVKPTYISTKEMTADILTKALRPEVFITLRSRLGLRKMGF